MSSVYVIARAYAGAIFDIAVERKEIEKWRSVLELFVRVSSYDLVRSLFFRSLGPEKLSNVFIAICEGFQRNKIDILAVNLIRIISEKNRFLLLPVIFEKFNCLYYLYYKRILKVEVISAYPLSNNQMSQIEVILSRQFDRTIDIVNIIKSNILAGIIIRIGDTVIDGSIYRRISRLKNYIL